MAEKRIKIAGFQLHSGKSSYKEKASMPGPSPLPGRVPRPQPFPPVPPWGSTPRLYQGLVSKKEGEPKSKFLPKYKSVFPRGSRKTKVFGRLPLPPAQGTPGEALPKGSPPCAPPWGEFCRGYLSRRPAQAVLLPVVWPQLGKKKQDFNQNPQAEGCRRGDGAPQNFPLRTRLGAAPSPSQRFRQGFRAGKALCRGKEKINK